MVTGHENAPSSGTGQLSLRRPSRTRRSNSGAGGIRSASLVPGPVWPPATESGARRGSGLGWRGLGGGSCAPGPNREGGTRPGAGGGQARGEARRCGTGWPGSGRTCPPGPARPRTRRSRTARGRSATPDHGRIVSRRSRRRQPTAGVSARPTRDSGHAIAGQRWTPGPDAPCARPGRPPRPGPNPPAAGNMTRPSAHREPEIGCPKRMIRRRSELKKREQRPPRPSAQWPATGSRRWRERTVGPRYHDPAGRHRAAVDPIRRSAAVNRSGGQPDPEPGTRGRT